MDIGEEQETIRVEPLEDPFRRETPNEPAREPAHVPDREEEQVPA